MFEPWSINSHCNPRQGHFPISGLEAALPCGFDSALRFRVADALAEEIRIAAEVLDWRQRNRIDAILDRDMAGGRKTGDPMSK